MSAAGPPNPTIPDLSVLEAVPTHVIVQELQRRHRVLGSPFRQFVILGPPGSGKSSLADHFRYNFGYSSLLPNESDAMLSSDKKLERISERVRAETARKGFVLDGYPVNVLEAKGLFETLQQKREEVEKKTGRWANTEAYKSQISGEAEKNKKLTQLDACIMLDVDDVSKLQGRLLDNQKNITNDELVSLREDNELVAKYLEKKMNVRCHRVDASLPKEEIMMQASKLVMKGDFDEKSMGMDVEGA